MASKSIVGGSEMTIVHRLSSQIDFEIFSDQLAMANIVLPENIIVHWTEEENNGWIKNFGTTNVNAKINEIDTGNHKFKIQVD